MHSTTARCPSACGDTRSHQQRRATQGSYAYKQLECKLVVAPPQPRQLEHTELQGVLRYELRQRVGDPANGSRNGSSSEIGCSSSRCETKDVATIAAVASNAVAATATCRYYS